MRKEQLLGDNIFVLHDFLSPEECQRYIALSEGAGFGDAPINGAGEQVVKSMRSNDRAMLDDAALAAELYERARPFLPDPFRGHAPCGFNERFRFYRYTAGQMFDWHFDGEFHCYNAACEASKLTFMVYLNDACEGGETLFHYLVPGVSDWKPDLRVRPSPGKALVFRHDVLHTGAEVTGGVKYVLRTDVMYRPLSDHTG
jgi:predicted 2-oxoglutarate/Fe(II)-dependent dioxygenase YbiX